MQIHSGLPYRFQRSQAAGNTPVRPSADAAMREMLSELEPWKAEGTWAPPRSGWFGFGRAWSDSPGAKYADHADTSLTTGVLSLAGLDNPRL
ncbi:MAG: hypothetical protein AB1758_01825, partial [Candidatus Eremiobacterota bacterium]